MLEWADEIFSAVRPHHITGAGFSISPSVLALLVGVYLALLLPARAAPSNPRFFHLTAADGLSPNIVRAIVQDPQGFLWFGTQDGLNRYDGYTFTLFRHLRSDPHAPAPG